MSGMGGKQTLGSSGRANGLFAKILGNAFRAATLISVQQLIIVHPRAAPGTRSPAPVQIASPAQEQGLSPHLNHAPQLEVSLPEINS